jgi:hypothetical protein
LRNGVLVYQQGWTGPAQPINLAGAGQPIDITQIQANYNDDQVVLWRGERQDGGSDLQFIVRDHTTGHWSAPLPVVEDGAEERSAQMAWDGNDLDFVYDRAATKVVTQTMNMGGVPAQVPASVVDPNGHDLVRVNHTLGSDASLQPEDVTITPPNPAPGTRATINAVVRNGGERPTGPVSVIFQDGDARGFYGVKYPTPWITETLPLLRGGEAITVTVPYNVPAVEHPHEITVRVRCDNGCYGRSNREVKRKTVLSELQLRSRVLQGAFVGTAGIETVVTNTGPISVTGVTLLTTATGVLRPRSEFLVGPFLPGKPVTITSILSPTTTVSGTYALHTGIEVDSTSMPDFDTSNNRATAEWTLWPDLMVEEPAILLGPRTRTNTPVQITVYNNVSSG